MRYLKYASYAVTAILAVVGAVIVYIAVTFDPNTYKDDLTALVKDKTGRALTIEGDIGLTFFPEIGIRLGRTSLSEYQGEAEFAGVEGARVALALLPLLSRQVVVDEVIVEGLRASVVKHKDGRTNVDDFLAVDEHKPTHGEPATAGGTIQPIKLDIQAIRVGNATLEFRDEGTGARYTASDLTLRTGRISQGVPTEVDLAVRLQASAPAVDLNARFRGNLQADLGTRVLEASDLNLAASGMHQADRVALALEAPGLSATPDKATAPVAILTLTQQGPRLDANVVIKGSGLEATAKAVSIGELTVDLNAKQADSAIQGRLATPVTADLEKQTLALNGFAGTLDIRSSAIPMGQMTVPFSGKASANLKPQSLDVDLAAKIEQSDIKATVGMNDFNRPRLRFDASVDRLDLDRYTSSASPQTEAQPGSQGAEKPFDLSALKTLNLSGRISVGELLAAKVRASNVQIDIKAQDGRLQIDPLVADLYRGRVRSAIAVDSNNNRVSVHQDLAGVSIGPLLKDALAQDLLEGHGDITLDLTAAGDTVSALKQSLSGGARLKLRDGAIKGVNLAQSLRNAKAALSRNKDGETAASPSEKTDFSELTASFSIRDGKARNEDLSVKSPFLRLSGAGEVDIARGRLDYLAEASLVTSSTGQGGRDRGELAGLTLPVRVSGPLAAPRFKLELSSALAGTAKSQFESKKVELKRKLETRLQDKFVGGKRTEQPDSGEAGSAPSDSSPSEPQPIKPEDELKKKLKGLLR